MSKSTGNPSDANGESGKDHAYFEQERELLVRDIGTSMEQVLQNLNKLNRSIEGIISVGNEFSSVEALWSHFETVMAKNPDDNKPSDAEDKDVGARETGSASKR